MAIRTPRVSRWNSIIGTGNAQCISPCHTLLSNCVPVEQRMRAWSLPALLFLSESEPVCRSVGRRPEARAHGGKATPPSLLRHPSRRIPLGSSSRRNRDSARCASLRTAPDSPGPSAWFPLVTTPDPGLINVTQSRKPKGVSGLMLLVGACSKPNGFSVILLRA